MSKNGSSSSKVQVKATSGTMGKSPISSRRARSASNGTASLPATTRWKEIADSVQNDIEEGRLSEGDLLPSETVLTEQWKVSRMTAHRAMQELQRSGLVTRQRGRGTLVAGNAPRVTGNIALLFHNPLDQLEIEYMRGINIGLADDYQLIFCDSHADPDREARYLQRMYKEVDGIICMPSGNPATKPILRKIADAGFPLVCVDRVPDDVELDAIVSDNFAATVEALEMLHGRGHRRIAHFTENDMHISAVRERYDAFIHVAREAGEAHPERLVRFFPTVRQNKFESTVQLMHDALFTLRHQDDPPTAVFCHNDYCLTLLLAAFDQLDVCVPRDMEILSFHDAIALMPSVTAKMHRIIQEPRQMGQLAADRLRRRITEGRLPREIVRVRPTICSLTADFTMLSRQQVIPEPIASITSKLVAI